MKKKWSAQKINVGSAIIGATVSLAIGATIGFNWNYVQSNFLPYLGFKKVATSDWSSLDEVYFVLQENYDGNLDKTALIEGHGRSCRGHLYRLYD